MIEIKFNARVFVHKSGNVLIRVRWNGKKSSVEFSTGVYADLTRWDLEKQCAVRGTTHKVSEHLFTAREINVRITECLGVINEVFAEFALLDQVPTPVKLKEKLFGRLRKPLQIPENQKFEKDFDEIFKEFMEKCGHERNWTEKVHCKYQQVWTHLHCCDPKVSLETLNKSKMQQLRDWYVKNNYKNRTSTKQFKILKSFLRWMLANGYPVNQEALEYKPNLIVVPKTVTYLKYRELKEFSDYVFPENKKYLEKARDMFVFMSLTSLRYSDLYNLRPSHINDNTITMYTVKTHDRITIPLTEKAKEIIEKYKGNPGKDGRLFPVPTDEKLNLFLKEAAEMAGLDKEFCMVYYIGSKRFEETKKMYEIIGCHDARRTFICISLALGIPAEIVMKASGHSDYESMKPYIEVADETQAQEMAKWDIYTFKSEIISLLDKASEEQMQKVLKVLKA